jgi:hypothetical protein
MSNPLQWALFIGPAWHPASDSHFWDYTTYDLEDADNLDFQTTVATTVNSGDTTVGTASAAGFSQPFGAWLGPNGSGQAWEYIDYFSISGASLNGVIREPTADREHNGIHSAGAKVRGWWKVAGDDGRLAVDMSLDESLTATDWTIQVSGTGTTLTSPQVAFQPFHIAIVQYRLGVTGSLKNLFVGLIDTSTIRDDKKRQREWSARISSVALLLKKNQVDGVRMGTFDAALHGSLRSSTPLGAAHKERWTGDFVAANPSFTPDVVQSEDRDAIWIGDRMIGTVEDPGSYDGFSQIYINPPLSVNAGTKWIEFINHDTASVELWAWDADLANTYVLTLPSESLNSGDRMIVAENAERFLAENPSQQAVVVFDVSGSGTPTWFNRLKAHGGAITFHTGSGKYGDIYWGDVTPSITGWGSVDWTGASMPAPAFDETMRWKANDHGHTNTKDDWEVSRRQSPGYAIQNNSRGEQAWIAVDLPSLGLILHDDILTATPASGSTLFIDGQNGPSTDGLPASGTICVGDEYITYSAKVAGGVTVSARGASGTTATAHVAGDAVFVVFAQAGRTTITDALPLSSLKWERSGGTIYPKDFIWRYSAITARTPDQEQHEDDYEIANTITGNVASSYTLSLSANRAKTVLVEFDKMTTDPARPRINKLRAFVDRSYFDTSRWLASGQAVENLIKQIGQNAGLPATALGIGSGGATPTGFITAVDKAWNVMASAAEMGASWIEVTRSAKINIDPDTFWLTGVGGYTPIATWDATTAADCRLNRTGGGEVSQVRITWKTPDESDGGIAKWPASPDAIGAVQELGTLYFATNTGATLAARKRYFLSRYPYEIEVTTAAGNWTIEPRQIHLVQWQFAGDMQPISRLVFVTSVSHHVDQHIHSTLFHGVVIDRESDG